MRDCDRPYETTTWCICPIHDYSKSGTCCRRARQMTPEEHDRAYDNEESMSKARIKERKPSEADFCRVLLEEAAHMRLSPRSATCRGRDCQGRSKQQTVGLPCVWCRRNIH